MAASVLFCLYTVFIYLLTVFVYSIHYVFPCTTCTVYNYTLNQLTCSHTLMMNTLMVLVISVSNILLSLIVLLYSTVRTILS